MRGLTKIPLRKRKRLREAIAPHIDEPEERQRGMDEKELEKTIKKLHDGDWLTDKQIDEVEGKLRKRL